MKLDRSQIQLAILISVIPIISSLFMSELLTLLFFTSLLAGIIKKPAKINQIWLTSVLLLWIIYGAGILFGILSAPGQTPGDETYASFMFESFIFMFFLVVIPIFVGRMIKWKK